MYCMPLATRVARGTAEDRCELIGPELTGAAPRRLQVPRRVAGPGQLRVRVPMNAKTVLRVYCLTGDVANSRCRRTSRSTVGNTWGGGCVANGCVYGVPSDSCRVLRSTVGGAVSFLEAAEAEK